MDGERQAGQAHLATGGLKVPARQPKRNRLWLDDGSCIRLRREQANHVWSYYFVLTLTEDERPLTLLVLIDECRQGLAIQVASWLKSDDVLKVLAQLFLAHGVPEHLRSDHGPEFIPRKVLGWLARLGVATLFIAPGSLWENGHCVFGG